MYQGQYDLYPNSPSPTTYDVRFEFGRPAEPLRVDLRARSGPFAGVWVRQRDPVLSTYADGSTEVRFNTTRPDCTLRPSYELFQGRLDTTLFVGTALSVESNPANLSPFSAPRAPSGSVADVVCP